MARPKSTEPINNARISIKLPKKDKKAIIKRARAKYMKMSEYFRDLYRKDLKK